jgi:CheY-like chemotaxis protein
VSVSSRVLIVDRSTESRVVLRMLLERGGATTIEARRPEQAIPLTAMHRPSLIVLDADSDDSIDGRATADLWAAARSCQAPIVILGTAGRPLQSGQIGQFVAKPYHYGPLVRKIEELLAAG